MVNDEQGPVNGRRVVEGSGGNLWIDTCWLLIDADNQTDEGKNIPSLRNQNY